MDRAPADVRPYLDLVNLLQSVKHDMPVPAIAVVGDEGSGKTSVLESLSGVELDRGRNYTLILKMKKGDSWTGSFHKMSPNQNQISKSMQHRKDVLALLEQYGNSKEIMQLVITDDVIILEISSADVPDLTLVDLPSIPQTYQDHEIENKIKEIISKPEVIILMVVPCNKDIATTRTFKLVQEVDPDGERILGLLTKPDIVEEGKEMNIVDIVQNKVINLKKGFMIVRCFDQRQTSLMDPKEKELKFFKEHALFKSLYDVGLATCPKLAKKLNQELAQNIEKYLPQLRECVKTELLRSDEAIKTFGKLPPLDMSEADIRAFLTEKINKCIQDVKKLTTKELLDITEHEVFTVWRKIVKESMESFQSKLKKEVVLHEKSGFSDFQIYDHVIKDHITFLEEFAVCTVSNSVEMVKKEILKLMEGAFYGFKNFTEKAKDVIPGVALSNQKTAEFFLRNQFMMEKFEIQAEARMYSNRRKEKESSPTVILMSYYQTVCQRLSSQIQLIIHFHIIKELSTELQNKMMQILDNKEDAGLLVYDRNLISTAEKIRKCFIPLTKAKMILSEL